MTANAKYHVMPAKFYFWEPPCSNHEFERPALLLIGISILNQLFSLVVHPDENINTLTDWEERFAQEGSLIWASGEKIPASVLLKNIHNIEKRKIHNPNPMMVKNNNKPVVKWDKDLYLYRFVPDGAHCIRHEPDYDIMLKIYSAYL